MSAPAELTLSEPHAESQALQIPVAKEPLPAEATSGAAPGPSERSRQLMTELQSRGLRLMDPSAGLPSRRGGAGPSDHKAVTIDGVTVMIPVHTAAAFDSPFVADAPGPDGRSVLRHASIPIASIEFPQTPKFYALQTQDGVPYSHIATLHGRDVLATTVLQT
ncbi:MAG: hypothetical protein RJB60_785, partial [Pseudomonadota bacterium]